MAVTPAKVSAAEPGETVTLSVNAAGVYEQTTSCGMCLTFDMDVLELVEATWTMSGELISDFAETDQMGVILFESPRTVSGKVCTLKFQVKNGAPAGSTDVSAELFVKPQETSEVIFVGSVTIGQAESSGEAESESETEKETEKATEEHTEATEVDTEGETFEEESVPEVIASPEDLPTVPVEVDESIEAGDPQGMVPVISTRSSGEDGNQGAAPVTAFDSTWIIVAGSVLAGVAVIAVVVVLIVRKRKKTGEK